MTATTFEDPRKTDLRERCAIALDAAGYEVVHIEDAFEIPGDAGLKGGILGDLHTRDDNGNIGIYCLRVSTSKPIPQWLANWSRAAASVDELSLYVVVDSDPSEDLIRSCRAAGGGLISLHADGIHRHVEPGEVPPDVAAKECLARIADIRRRMENKLRLNLDAVENNFTDARELTAEFPDELQDEYMTGIEEKGERWRRWSEDISEALDSVAATCDDEELRLIEELLEDSPE